MCKYGDAHFVWSLALCAQTDRGIISFQTTCILSHTQTPSHALRRRDAVTDVSTITDVIFSLLQNENHRRPGDGKVASTVPFCCTLNQINLHAGSARKSGTSGKSITNTCTGKVNNIFFCFREHQEYQGPRDDLDKRYAIHSMTFTEHFKKPLSRLEQNHRAS